MDSLRKAVYSGKGKMSAYGLLIENYITGGQLDSALKTIDQAKSYLKGKKDTLSDYATLSYQEGTIYFFKGDIRKTLELNLQALKFSEMLRDSVKIGNSLLNVGNVFIFLKNYENARSYYDRALVYYKGLNDKASIANILNNLGSVSYEEGDWAKAKSEFGESYGIRKQQKDTAGLGESAGNLGSVYFQSGDYKKALQYQMESIRYREITNDISGLATTYEAIASIWLKLKDPAKAETYYMRSMALNDRIGYKEGLKSNYSYLAKLYAGNRKFDDAYRYLEKYVSLNDTLLNAENLKQVNEMQAKYESVKKDKELIKKDAEIHLHESESRQKALQRNAFVAGFILVLGLAFVSFRGYRIKRKANTVITSQKQEVEKQRDLVEEKQKEILDSIAYAKRLQTAILPSEKLVKNTIPDSFVLYKPKDIVAGDFYWMEKIPGNPGEAAQVLIAAADCTGHGVPGALVSVVCSNALNRTVKEFGVTDPGLILDKVRELVIETFQKSENEVKDGMDISLCSINQSTCEVLWSGANNPLWYIQHNEMKEITASKQPIGKSEKEHPFLTHTIQLQEGDLLYLFTDGYADQFGGPRGKKFKYKQLEDLLKRNSLLAMDEQKSLLNKSLEEWKGDLEQVDDVLIIGIRL